MNNLILYHKCLECDFECEIEVEGRVVICPQCFILNDFWLDGESVPDNHIYDDL